MTKRSEGIAVRTDGLTKRYSTRAAVDGVTLEVRRGEVYGFLGVFVVGIVLWTLGATAEGPDATPGVLTVLSGPSAALLVALYLAAFLGGAVVLVRRRDVS